MEGPNSMQVSLDFGQNCPISAAGRELSACCSGRSAPARPEPAAGLGVHTAQIQKRICGGWTMGRGLLLWLIGIPLPIILVIWLFGGLS
jgi:hypothetical protein